MSDRTCAVDAQPPSSPRFVQSVGAVCPPPGTYPRPLYPTEPLGALLATFEPKSIGSRIPKGLMICPGYEIPDQRLSTPTYGQYGENCLQVSERSDDMSTSAVSYVRAGKQVPALRHWSNLRTLVE